MEFGVSLAQTISELRDVVREVENAEKLGTDPSQKLMPAFEGASSRFLEAVDHRIQFIENLELLESRLHEEISFLKQKLAATQKIKESIVSSTRQYMQENPGLVFEGTQKKFVLRKNGGKEPILWNTEFSEVKNVIPYEIVNKVPSRYIEWMEVPVLKKSEFENDLRTGRLKSGIAIVGERSIGLRIC